MSRSGDSRVSTLVNLKSWPKVREMLLDGEAYSSRDIAKFIQQQGEMADISEESVSRKVRRMRSSGLLELYEREDTAPTLRALGVPRAVPERFGEFVALESPLLSGNGDSLDAMKAMVDLQLARVKRGYDLEEKMGIPLPSLRAEVSLLYDMLERMIKIEQSIGLRATMPEVYASFNATMNVDSGMLAQAINVEALSSRSMVELMRIERELAEKAGYEVVDAKLVDDSDE